MGTVEEGVSGEAERKAKQSKFEDESDYMSMSFITEKEQKDRLRRKKLATAAAANTTANSAAPLIAAESKLPVEASAAGMGDEAAGMPSRQLPVTRAEEESATMTSCPPAVFAPPEEAAVEVQQQTPEQIAQAQQAYMEYQQKYYQWYYQQQQQQYLMQQSQLQAGNSRVTDPAMRRFYGLTDED